MSPTQLRTLRHFIEEKHAMDIERAATVRQMQAEQLTSSDLDKRRQQQRLISTTRTSFRDPISQMCGSST